MFRVTKLTIFIFLFLYLLVKSCSPVFIICIQKHFQSIILQMGTTNYFLSNSFIITQLFLKLKENQMQSLWFWTYRNVHLSTNYPNNHFKWMIYMHFSKRCITMTPCKEKSLCLSQMYLKHNPMFTKFWLYMITWKYHLSLKIKITKNRKITHPNSYFKKYFKIIYYPMYNQVS